MENYDDYFKRAKLMTEIYASKSTKIAAEEQKLEEPKPKKKRRKDLNRL